MKTKISNHPFSWTTGQWGVFVLTLIVLMLLATIVNGQMIQNDHLLIDKLANEYVNQKQNRALVVGIIRNNKQEVYTYGETEKDNKTSPNVNSIFELGQMSETFTASLLAILESKGKISSQEAVRDILKGIVKVPYYQRFICKKIASDFTPSQGFRPPVTVCFPDQEVMPQAIVLCDLATHSSGLPEEPYTGLFSGKNPFKDYTIEKLNNFISQLPPNQSFGYEYQYSMPGIALLGEAMSIKMKTDYATLLKNEILDPLAMNHTFITPNTEQEKNFLNGHTNKGNYTPHRDYNALSPAAGIRSNAPDLLTFLAANLSEKNALNTALRETHVPHIYSSYDAPKFTVSWGWIQVPLDKNDLKNSKKMIWQCGERGGFSTFMAFVKESNTAVVVLSNTNNSVDELGQNILKSLGNSTDKIKTASIVPIKN